MGGVSVLAAQLAYRLHRLRVRCGFGLQPEHASQAARLTAGADQLVIDRLALDDSDLELSRPNGHRSGLAHQLALDR
jgi:hypothetical protein